MKLKSLLVSLSMALAGSLAQASPVTIADSGNVTGSFSNAYNFTVTQNQNYLFSVVTKSQQQDLTIRWVTLTNAALNLSYTFDAADDGTLLSASAWWTSSITSGLGVTSLLQQQTFSLSEILLAPGTWTVTVSGLDSNAKTASSFALTANAVPEPQSLALSVVGLLALGWATRRGRRSAKV